MKNAPLTDRAYWDAEYADGYAKRDSTHTPQNLSDSKLDAILKPFLEPRRGQNVVELGCGGSYFLPRTSQKYNLKATGIDYSPLGCQTAKAAAAMAGVEVDVIEGDFFSPSPDLLGKFSVVASFGVVEHFDDTAATIKAFSNFLSPDGIMVTTVPCMKSLYGTLIRRANHELWAKHKPLNSDLLRKAHEDAGLRVLHAQPMLGLPMLLSDNRQGWKRKILGGASDLYSRLEQRGLGVPPNNLTSPYAVCVAERVHH